MTDETLYDVAVRAGLARPRRRPLPRSMRPAWERAPEATQPLPTPHQAQNDPRTVPYYTPPTVAQIDQQNQLRDFAMRREVGRNEVNTPSGAYFGQDALEMTGAPALARGIGHLRDGEPGRALPEVALGGASLLGWGAGALPRAPRPVPRMPAETAPRLPNAPARLPGRATDGSVLPIRPPEPIRQSLVGGSDDLAEAARMRSGPDAGPVRGGRVTRIEDPQGERDGIRTYESQRAYVTIERQPGDTVASVGWSPRRQPPASLAERAQLERDGIEDAIDAMIQDARSNPGTRYSVQGGSRALIRRYQRLAEERAAASGFSVSSENGTLVLEPRTLPDGGPVQTGRAPDAPLPSTTSEGVTTYRAANTHVRIQPFPSRGVTEVTWEPNGGLRPEGLVDRARLEQEGIDAAMRAMQQHAAQHGDVTYTVHGSNGALARRYRRLAQERAEAAGFTFEEASSGGLIFRRAERNGPKIGRAHV